MIQQILNLGGCFGCVIIFRTNPHTFHPDPIWRVLQASRPVVVFWSKLPSPVIATRNEGGEGKSCHLGISPAALFTMWNRLISRPADIDKISKENQSPAVDESLCDFEVVPCCEENVKIRKVNDARHGETTTHPQKNMKKQSLHHKNLAGMTNLIEKTRVKKIDLDQGESRTDYILFFPSTESIFSNF